MDTNKSSTTQFSGLTLTPNEPKSEVKESYFEKNKKMIVLFVILLLIFFALIGYIVWSQKGGTNIATGSKAPETSDDEIMPTPIVSSAVDTPTPTPTPVTPTTKEISFILDEHIRVPGGVDDGNAKKVKFTLTVPTSTVDSAATDDLAQDLVNTDFSMRINIPYEISGITHFTEKVAIGVVPNMGNQVFRVKEEGNTDNSMIYVNDDQIANNNQCVWEAAGVTREPPCGGSTLFVQPPIRYIEVRCTPKTNMAFDSCDSIVKSIKLELL